MKNFSVQKATGPVSHENSKAQILFCLPLFRQNIQNPGRPQHKKKKIKLAVLKYYKVRQL
jgi:hypothetical protein